MSYTNSNYSYVYHIAGSCQTPEESVRVLEECLNARKMSVSEYEHALKVRENDIAILKDKIIKLEDSLQITKVELEIEKINIHSSVEKKNYEYALEEIRFINECLKKLEPFCMWYDGSMTKEDGFQLAQREERKFLLIERAQISLLANGRVDSETLREIKSHPDSTLIDSTILYMIDSLRSGTLQLSNRKPLLLLSEKNQL